ncbi:MAG: FeoA family protein [Thermodesulfobacteriota bacterium]
MSSHPLCHYPNGSKVRVTALDSCSGARCRLCSLGLTPGTEVEITQNGPGPCRLRVRGSDLVLGHGLAHKVMAAPTNGE